MRIRANHVISAVILVIAAVLLYALFTTQPSQGAAPGVSDGMQDGAPRISLASYTLDLGEISNDGPTKRWLDLTNKGGEPLRILSTQGSCPCVRAWVETNPIPSGETVKLYVEMDPFKISGFSCIEKTVSIRSNDPAQEIAVVNLPCTIEPEFEVVPPFLDFGNMAKGETAEQSLVVRQLEDEPPLEVTDIATTHGGVQGLEWRLAPIPAEDWAQPGHAEYRVTATITAEARPGPMRARAKIMTNVERLKNGVTTEAHALINASYRLQPGHQIRMVNAAPGQERAGRLTIEAENPIKVRDVKVSTDAFIAHLRPTDDPSTAFIDIDISGTAEEGRAWADLTFTIETDGRVLPETVSLRAYVRPAGDEEADRPEPIRVTPRNR